METIEVLTLTLGVAWASGINLYASILVLGYFGMTGDMQLPADLEILSHPAVMGAAGLMYCVEFFADKTPGVDTGWDTIHSFIRIPAGAMLAAGMSQGIQVNEATELAALILGGGIAATTHTTKMGTRALINTSPEPFSNWGASITEDIAVIGGLWAALNHPWIFLGALIVFFALVIWLLPKIWRALKSIFQGLGRLLSGKTSEPPKYAEPPPTQSKDDLLKSMYKDASIKRE